MQNVRLIEQSIDVTTMLQEIAQQESLWLKNTNRQDKIRCQRETQTIFLRTAKQPFPEGASGNDVRESERTKISYELPAVYAWVEAFGRRIGGELGRAMLVRLKPRGKIYSHVDNGSYYEYRDRYHLLLHCPTPSSMICGSERVEMRGGELWWFDNKREYEEVNAGDDWRIHLIIDILPTPVRPRPGSPFKHFELLQSHVDIQPMRGEIAAQEELWHVDTSRQDKIRVQRETSNIPLRSAARPHPKGIQTFDIHPSATTDLAQRFPVIFNWVQSYARQVNGELGRATIVRLNPHAQVYRHIDEGEYYKIRDRYHLVLHSPGGSEMIIGDEKVVFRDGELWWFDNKAPHEAYNNSDDGRIHVIFDVRPLQRQNGHITEKQPDAPPGPVAIADSSTVTSSEMDAASDDTPPNLSNLLGDLTEFLAAHLDGKMTMPSDALRGVLENHVGPVYLGFRSQGALVHEQWAHAKNQLESLMQGIRRSRETAGASTWDQMDAVELCLSGDFRPVPNLAQHVWKPALCGIRGLELQVGDDVITRQRVSPTTMLAANQSFEKIIAAYSRVHRLSPDAMQMGRLRVRTFGVSQFLIQRTRLPATRDSDHHACRVIPLLRGKEYVDVRQIDRSYVARLEQLLGEYLVRNVQPDGRIPYTYFPSEETEDTKRNNQIRQWMATLALSRLAAYHAGSNPELARLAQEMPVPLRYPPQEIFDAADRNIRYNLEHFYREQDGLGLIDDQGKIKLGAIALAVLAIASHPQRAKYKKYEECLWKTIDHLQKPTGAFQTFFSPGDKDDYHNFYPGEALLAWSTRYTATHSGEVLARIRKSFLYYREWHRKNRNPAFVPWHTQAYFTTWQKSFDPEMRDFIFEMNDWLLAVQQWDDAPHDDCRGRFYDPHRPFGPPHASSTGVYLEGLIDAFHLARIVGDRQRTEAYRVVIVRGIRDTAQLTFKDDIDMYYVRNRETLRGGVRTTVYDNVVRVDNVQHNLMAILKILTVFQDDDFRMADPLARG